MQHSVADGHGQTTPTLQQQDAQRIPLEHGPASSPSIMAVTALPAGRRASSPPPRPISPANTNASFQPSSSQHSSVATANNNSRTAGRFSDAFSSIVGRTRTLSTDSKSRDFIPSRPSQTQLHEDNVAESSFGIEADPFASRPSGPSTQNSHSTVDPTSILPPQSSTTQLPRKQRGSFLFAASDALGFGRVGASISKKMGKRSSMEQSTIPSANQTQPQPQQRRGLLWKGKGKPKGHWALQPPSSSHIISDVIEISAAKAGLTAVRDEEEENERRERDRLREAAAESIGISPLFREISSSRVTESDGARFDDDSVEDTGSRERHEQSVDDDPAEKLRVLDRSLTSVASTTKQEKPLQFQQTRESRHNRSSSLSGMATPTTPSSSSHWPLPPLVPPIISANGRAPKGSSSPTFNQQPLPPFPCLYSALGPLSRKSSSLLKFFPSSSLLHLGFSRQWRTRTIVLTTPPRPKSPSLSGFRPFTPPERLPSVCHLHLFKSSGADERELERLEVNENSVVFVAEEETAGKRSVVKVGGVDVGGRKRELNMEEYGQTMWLLSISDANAAQDWITTLKSAVLDQRAEKAGFAMPTSSLSATGPKGDLDVMLSIRAQDVASTVRSKTQIPLRTSHEETRVRNSESPTPTTRSWSGEGRRPASPSGRMISLKGLFSVPGRARSMSHDGPGRGEDSPTTPVDAPSFTSRGTTLLNMIRTPNGNVPSVTVGIDSKSAPTSPVAASQALPTPIPYPGPILSVAEMNLDRPSSKERDRELPEWYSIHNHHRIRGDSSSSHNVGPALLPPPRIRRPWTSAGLSSNAKREQATDGASQPPRRSFQSAISLHGARLSLDGKTRPASPVDSLGTATGVFGTAEVGSKRASLSSSVSSFVTSAVDRDQLSGRSSSSIQRRMRAGKLPKMLTPPAGPPPSVPANQQLSPPSSSYEDPNARSLGERPPSRSSSLRSASNSDMPQNGNGLFSRRLSESSALSAGSMSPPSVRGSYNSVRKSSNNLSPKRTSIPPPPRPAPTTALPPTPPEADTSKVNGISPRKATFRESFSHRSLRFSLSPPPSKNTSPRPDDSFRRRSVSTGGSLPGAISSHAPGATMAPPAPPPTGPLPPTPRDPIFNRYSLRERLRMKSAPSTPPLGILRRAAGPPTTMPGSPPLVTVSSVASLKENAHAIPIGEPITAIPKDLNFLSMSPIDSSTSPTDETDFLNISTPLTTTFPKQIPIRPSDYPPPHYSNGSPPTPEMTVLPPPPRRGRSGTISEKDRERSPQSFVTTVGLTAEDGTLPRHTPPEPVAAL